MSFKYPVYIPLLVGNEKKYVNECLDSTWISSKGKFVDLFENRFSEYTGNPHSISVCNGTLALYLAMLGLDIKAGDEVIVPTFTYIASVNCINYVGATPVFVDSLKNNLQADPEDVEKKITKKTKAIICVHLYGHPCDTEALRKIADKHGVYLIEDCAEALGSRIKGKHVGNAGDIATYSFFGNKTVTTGEGGMVTALNKTLSNKMRKIKSQGLQGDIEYWHDVVGHNFRMTNIQAAIGFAQMEKIDEILQKKRQIAEWYNKYLDQSYLKLLFEDDGVVNSFWMCTITLDDKVNRAELRKFLAECSIETRPGFYPAHTMPMYKHLADEKAFEIANKLAASSLNLPSYPALAESDIKYISENINQFCNKGTKAA